MIADTDGALATAPQSRARPLRLRLPAPGPTLHRYATTVHHLIPSSQAPHLFWEPSNLVAACRRCNYGDGRRIAAEDTRQTIERLRALVEEQERQIAQMAERLARHEDEAAKRRAPAIY